jgi:hypothetical protein
VDALVAHLSKELKSSFFSSPPSSALILLWPTASLHQQRAIVTREDGKVGHPHEDQVTKILGAPLVLYSYDGKNNFLEFKIRGEVFRGHWSDKSLGREVAAALGIPYQAGRTMKAANNPQQVTDLFHVWSRASFAGIQKTDIDFLLLDDRGIRALIEVKRSAKVPVGEWMPYKQDPYDGLAHFAQTWKVPLFTIHHTIVGEREGEGEISYNTVVDVFEYHPHSPFDFDSFASDSNRQVMPLQDLIKRLQSLHNK